MESIMSDAVINTRVESFRVRRSPHKTSMKAWLGTALVLSLFGGGVIFGPDYFAGKAQASLPQLSTVVVSVPAERNIEKRLWLIPAPKSSPRRRRLSSPRTRIGQIVKTAASLGAAVFVVGRGAQGA